MGHKKEFVLLTTTVAKKRNAEVLAAKIVEDKLAACVQFMPVKSIYRWKGRVESANEILLICKTKAKLAWVLTEFIRENHDYELPEIVVSRIDGGLSGYLNWIDRETK